MSWRASSRRDRGKAPIYSTSHWDFSSSDATISASEWEARVLQSHFDRGGDDTRPTSKIPIKTRSRRRRSVEIVSVLSESRTISSGAFSRRKPTRGRKASRGETLVKDLLFDIEADFSKEEEVYPGAWRRGLRPRFPPRQARANAHIRAVDGDIRDTHLQHGLKDHPSTQARKGEVCCLSSFVI